MLDANQLEEMSQMDIAKMDRALLVDIANVQINTAEPIQTRFASYVDQIKNPYCFMNGKTPVKVSFNESGRNLDDILKSHFIALKTT